MLQKKIRAIAFICASLPIMSFIVGINPAQAHHPLGGRTPATFIEGFLSGLGHPIIGLDHFAFVVAIGLIAVLTAKRGLLLPITFSLATALGTVIHLSSIDLPAPELIISVSVFTIGLALAMNRQFNLLLLILLGAIAGLFHGYAYGESIFGAETTPVAAYLLGFASIQILISAISFYVGKLAVNQVNDSSSLYLRFAGFTIAGIGLTFLSNAILG
ncbi:hydrogenase/urease accessory protein [Xenococcus sp. PCC 7305]|uniref:HupE/UreJ family protein n=1 Tax=Xenococcus sp. PCC 7305 TaxID=102125 RepID=UPI0002ACB9B9|nr:HupE/UreJ family protein [Xenococcus sp. PCC 7305]ELS03977.1 hydrogenase/urease accessory protein [Xenococcus sp. PCC 7305]